MTTGTISDAIEISDDSLPNLFSMLVETALCKLLTLETCNLPPTSSPVTWMSSGASPATTIAYVTSTMLAGESDLACSRLASVLKSMSMYSGGTVVRFPSASRIASLASGLPIKSTDFSTTIIKEPVTLNAARHLQSAP